MRVDSTRLVLGLMVILMAGCKASEDAKTAGATADPLNPDEASEVVIPVEVELPRREDISSYFETNSRVEAESGVQIMAQAVGECLSVNAEEGDRVEAGDILAELDKTEALATIGQTEVQVRQTKTSYEIAQGSLAAGIGSAAERDNAQFAHEQALAALKMQKVQVDKLTIRAPIGGVVTQRNVQVGQLVSAGMPLFSIVDPSSFMLAINPPEKELARLRLGQTARVTIDAFEGEEYGASVRRINPAVDALSGTVKVTLDFDEAVREKLRDAAFARVRLTMETHENALLVPKDAVLEKNGRTYVFVVEDAPPEEQEEEVERAPEEQEEEVERAPEEQDSENEGQDTGTESPAQQQAGSDDAEEDTPNLIAKRIEVETGLDDSNAIEIVSGIDEHALVVTLGQHTLKPDTPVRVTNVTDAMLAKADLGIEEALARAKAKRAGEDRKKAPRVHGGRRRR